MASVVEQLLRRKVEHIENRLEEMSRSLDRQRTEARRLEAENLDFRRQLSGQPSAAAAPEV